MSGAGAGISLRELTPDQVQDTIEPLKRKALALEGKVRTSISAETPENQALQLNQLLNWLKKDIRSASYIASPNNTTLTFTFLSALLEKGLTLDPGVGSTLPESLKPLFEDQFAVKEAEPSSPTSILMAALMTTPPPSCPGSAFPF